VRRNRNECSRNKRQKDENGDKELEYKKRKKCEKEEWDEGQVSNMQRGED
jgi:hypothetical protein